MKPPKLMMHRPALISALCLVLGACTGLVDIGPSGPPAAIYTLQPLGRDQDMGPDAPLVFVEEPQVSGALDTSRIAIRRSDVRYEYLGGARWEEHTARLIQRYMARSLDNTRAIDAVGEFNIDIPVSYRLRLDVRRFEARLAESDVRPVVEVGWVATVMDATSATILATEYFEVKQAASGDDVTSVVTAYNEAMNVIARDLSHWLQDLLSAPMGDDDPPPA